MTAEEYLNSYGIMKRILENDIEFLNDLRANAYKPPSVGFGEFRRTNIPSDRVGALTAKISVQEDKIRKAAVRLNAHRQQIETFTDQLEDARFKMFLIDYYIEGKTIAQMTQESAFTQWYWYKVKRKSMSAFKSVYSRNMTPSRTV